MKHLWCNPHMLLCNQLVQLIRDRWVSDICAANLTATISDENIFRTNGKGGAIVDPIKFEYISPNPNIARYAATNQQIRFCPGEALYKFEFPPKKPVEQLIHHTPKLRNSISWLQSSLKIRHRATPQLGAV